MRFAQSLVLALSLATAPVPGEGEQYAIDYGNGYAQNVEVATGFLVGETYVITPAASAAPVACCANRAPVTRAPSAASVPDMIVSAAQRHGVNAQRMLRIAWCESKYLPGAVGDSGASVGVFQFQRPLWSSTPYANYDRTVGWANIEAAAWVMARPHIPAMGFQPWRACD